MIDRIVHFEDHGQDFLRWWIRDNEVIASWPFQGSQWHSAKVFNLRFARGGFLRIQTRHGSKLTIKYPIAKVFRLGPESFLCAHCGSMHDRGPIGGAYHCLACCKKSPGRIPKVREATAA